ncbi:MAG: type II secretion system F family protein [Coprobacillus sp.]
MKKNKVLTNSEIASFNQQMAMILHAGISAYEGISIMQEDNQDALLKPILHSIQEELQVGQTFYDALLKADAFPSYMLDMIHIGEVSGKLEDVLASLGNYYERLYDNSENIKNAVSYPFIMIIMMLLVVLILITQVLPIFNRVFEQLGSSITGFSKVVLDVGNVLSSYSYIFIGIFIIGIILYFFFTRNEKGKENFYNFLTRCRLTRDISLKLALSQFTSGMAIALSSGLNIDQSMDMAKQLVSHKDLKNKIDQAQEMLGTTDIASSLCDAKVLTGMYARLIKIGYKTGGMDSILKDIADRYDNETNERITRLISIIEPTLVAVLSIMVGLILLSIMMPLIGIMSSL